MTELSSESPSHSKLDTTTPQDNTIGNVLLGRVSRKFMLTRWILIGSILFWGFLLISYFYYPKEDSFSIMTHSISFLGDWYDNPYPGWLFFTIALTMGGIVFFPIGMYIYRRMAVVGKKFAIFFNFLYILGCIGVILVGIFADVSSKELWGMGINDIHNNVAVLGFGGILLAALGYQVFPFFDRRNSKPGENYLPYKKLRIATATLWFFILGMAISQALRGVLGYNDVPGPGLYSFTFWEWMDLAGIWIYYILLVKFLPEDLPENITN